MTQSSEALIPTPPESLQSIAQARGTWATIREALGGSHQNYTEGPIGRAIFLLAVPMVLEMLMESVFAVVDIFFVARLGANAVAAVGLTESLLAVVYALAMGLGIGATALVARRTGEKDADGATGAAIATTIGRSTGALYALSRLFGHGGRVPVRRHHLRLAPDVMRQIVRLSGTATVQALIGTASWIGLVRIISVFGSAALAGYTVGIRVIIFALLPSWGLSNAAATMVGQALGARNPEREERAVWKTGFYNMCCLGLVGLGFVLFAEPIVGFFTSDPAVAAYGVDCLRVIAFGFRFYAYGMVLTQSFNGAGDTWTPTLLNFAVFWLWEIPLAYALAIWFDLGPQGVFLALTIAFSTLAIVSALVFRQGKWKTRRV